MAAVDLWLIVGHRRWARVVAAEVCSVVSSRAIIRMQGEPADTDLRRWLQATGLETRIEVVSDLQPCRADVTAVALVVNSAPLHRQTIEAALAAGYHVISEKPLAFSATQIKALIDEARSCERALFCTNTYLFADYLKSFRERWLSGRRIETLRIVWADPRQEVRHGGAKGYDSSVPLILDVLPHVTNIVTTVLARKAPVEAASLDVLRGGGEVWVRYRHDGVLVEAHMVRNASRRIRMLTCTGPDLALDLDFTTEPGIVVSVGQPSVLADPDWQTKPKPIAAMLTSVMQFFETGRPDTRLDASASLLGSSLIDAVMNDYVDRQVELLQALAAGARDTEEDVLYASKEARMLADRASAALVPDSPLRRLAAVNLDPATNPARQAPHPC